MKRASFAVGVLIALFMIWRFPGDHVSQDTEATRAAAVAVPDSPDETLPPPDSPAETSEGSEHESPDLVESGAAPDSCAELYRRAETSNMRIAFAEGREDEAGCARMLRMVFGPRVPAIPGFAGFEVRDMGDLSPRAKLANESDNPEWSRAMEGAILEEIASLLDFPVTTLHAACKSSTCGLLFAYRTVDHHGGNYNFFAQELADELGFSGYHGGHSRGMDGSGFTYVYLGDWQTRRPDDGSDQTVPASFEDIAGAAVSEPPGK